MDYLQIKSEVGKLVLNNSDVDNSTQFSTQVYSVYTCGGGYIKIVI